MKKILQVLCIASLVFTGFTFIPGHKAEAATKCVNPYKGYLAKYNPCVTHTQTEYIYVKKNNYATPIALTAAGVTTTSVNKILTSLGARAIPGVGAIVWGSDALTVADYYLNKHWRNKGIKRFKVTYTYKYYIDTLKDGGGFPRKKVLKTVVKAEYK
ncbi:hypothetical protein MOC74_22310 [Bacillus haynesii]|uniref:hypothetical protein n=1 Tax=Bacillus haynesii TaxID=1925021 RepID=UPI002280097E|nr:hypothetical protein [Bacillus haynesii]MCY8348134.1 hypothetical protein [Bacillus haynesii]MCY8559005.1 hypothetical protein [Bacillus haynesii]MEC0722735.1 hypothetical protein [Bacillus haynesii]